MDSQRAHQWSRREFLGGLTLAGTAGLFGLRPGPIAADPPPETTTLRLAFRMGLSCHAPLHVANEFLSGEGFTDVRYVGKETIVGTWRAVVSGEADITMSLSAPTIILVDEGVPIVFLAGVHVGCFELFGTDRVRTIRDLKGKTVAVVALGSSQHVFIASMAAYVGLDPRKDINWVTHSYAEAVRLLTEGKIDAYMATPPESLELRAKKVGHVVLNTMMDRPWSQYFCCIATGNREFVRKNPVATKRVLRAILKATDVCARELFGTDRVRTVRDLKGKTIAVPGIWAVPHLFLVTVLAHVGVDPAKDVNFIVRPSAEAKMLLAEGKVDGYLGFPPDPQELRAKKIGRVLLASAVDRPWSQYFCCFVMANREFVRKHPVATKRAVRAILKADGVCALEPERAAQTLIGLELTKNYEYALQSMRDVPYGRWRDYSPEDTVRFYALRLHEAGMIKSSPKKIIAQGTDWRFLNELKKELKG